MEKFKSHSTSRKPASPDLTPADLWQFMTSRMKNLFNYRSGVKKSGVRDCPPDVFEAFQKCLKDDPEHLSTSIAFEWFATGPLTLENQSVRLKFAEWIILHNVKIQKLIREEQRDILRELPAGKFFSKWNSTQKGKRGAITYDEIIQKAYHVKVISALPPSLADQREPIYKKLEHATIAEMVQTFQEGNSSKKLNLAALDRLLNECAKRAVAEEQELFKKTRLRLKGALDEIYGPEKRNAICDETLVEGEATMGEMWEVIETPFTERKKAIDKLVGICGTRIDDFRRRLPETSSVSVQDPAPALDAGSSSGLLVLLLLAVAFLVYWLVIRRFRRPDRKPRDYLRDLEAGRPLEDLCLVD